MEAAQKPKKKFSFPTAFTILLGLIIVFAAANLHYPGWPI